MCLSLTKGPGPRAAGIALAYKLIDAAQAHWSASTPRPVTLVRVGAALRKSPTPRTEFLAAMKLFAAAAAGVDLVTVMIRAPHPLPSFGNPDTPSHA